MQLFAKDQEGNFVAAGQAARQCDYVCGECGGVVRVRQGRQRRVHFFHLQHNRLCRQSGKSETHWQVQYHLLHRLPLGEAHLEYRFAAINRIADLYWEPQRLVFEVQCSPMDPEEMIARNRDYASVGLRVIWILHDSLYNKEKMSPIESALQHHPHYYTSINAQGKGIIYDQVEKTSVEGWRRVLIPLLEVDLSRPNFSEERGALPRLLAFYRGKGQPYFAGDRVDRFLSEKDFADVLTAMDRWARLSLWRDQMISIVRRWVIRPYLNLFQLFLEKACR